MEKVNLTVEEILDKQFNVDFKGYSASEVDAFLDIILEDYQIYEENLDELKSEIQKLHEEVAELKKQSL